MRIRVTTIYAAQILGYMATTENRLVTVKELVAQIGITYQYCLKVMNELKKAGLLESEQGCKGGFYLKTEPESITVDDVMEVFEESAPGYVEKKEAVKKDPFKMYMDKLYLQEKERMKHTALVDIYRVNAAEKKR